MAFLSVVAIWVAFEKIATDSLAHDRAAALQTTDALAEGIADDARGILATVELLAGVANEVRILWDRGAQRNSDTDVDRLRRLVDTGLLGAAGVTIIGADGWTLWSSSALPHPIYLGDRDYFRAAREHPDETYVGPPVPAPDGTGPERAPAVRALRSASGAFDGAVVVWLDPRELERRLSRPLLRKYGTAGLLRTRDLVILAHSQTTPELAALPNGAAPWGIGEPIRGVLGNLIRVTPSGHIIGVGGHTGRLKTMSWRQVTGMPLTVYATLDEQEMLAETVARGDLLRTLAALASLVVAGAVAGGMLARSATRRREAQHHAEERQAAAEATFAEVRRLLSDLPVVVFESLTISPHEGRLIRPLGGNPEQTLGCNLDSIQEARGVLDHVVPEDHARLLAQREDLLRDGRGGVEVRWIRDDGRLLTLAMQSRVVDRLPGGARVVHSWADMTELARLRLQSTITGRLAALGEMARGIAHELNQPLAIISMAAENLLGCIEGPEPDLPGARRRAVRISEQALRASGVIEELRRFSQPDSETPVPVSLPQAWAGALKLLGAQLRHAGIEPVAIFPADLPPVLGTTVQVQQVLVNIVLNARDALVATAEEHTPRRVPQLRLTAVTLADRVQVEIADNGGGIPEDAMPRIFEPYFTTKPVGAGPGLGLSICHGILRTLGGDIAVRNEGGGAVFTVKFRRADQFTRADDGTSRAA